MDYSRILSKPFLVKEIPWPSTIQPFNYLQAPVVFPQDIFSNNLIKIPFQASTLFRCKACFMVQVSGTTMHQGTLIAAVTPYKSPGGAVATATNNAAFVNNLLASPHVFLNANNSTAACIEIPFNYNNKLCYCDPDNNVVNLIASGNNFAQLNLTVLNQLTMPASASTSVSVLIHVIFEELEFFAPHVDVTFRANPQIRQMDSFFKGLRNSTIDFLDSGIQFVRSYTGLHNRNLPLINHKVYNVTKNDLNNVDQETKLEKLDPYGNFDRKVADYVFYTDQDEMDVRFLFNKPYYITTFNVLSSTTPGAVLMSRPITPWMEDQRVNNASCLTFPLSIFHRLSKFWKGSLKLHIQSNMTAFHFCKLVVARNYSPVSDALLSYPNFLDVQNLLTETLEFSNGGQIQTIDLPFISPFNQLDCTQSPTVNAMQHGLVYIFLAQPLIVNGTVPQTISFNVYLSAGDDFCYYGYPTSNLGVLNASGSFNNDQEEEETSLISFPGYPELVDDERVEWKQNPPNDNRSKVTKRAFKQTADSVIPMQVPSQDELIINKSQTIDVDDVEFRPILSIRDVARRFYQYPAINISGTSLTDPMNRSHVINLSNNLGFTGNLVFNSPTTPLVLLSRMFYGFVGGLKFKLRINGASNVSVKYIPPGIDPNLLNNQFATSNVYANSGNTGSATINSLVASNFEGLPYNAPGGVFPTVGLDVANYVHCQSYNTSSYGDHPFSSSITEIEGMIPYMNSLSFLGDMLKGYGTPSRQYYSSNLGYLIVSFVPVASLDGATVSDVLITPFYGLSDEARYGLNTISLPATILYYPTSTFYTPSPYNSTTNGAVNGGPSGNTSDAAACYYTRT